jgi:hypothetical protein
MNSLVWVTGAEVNNVGFRLYRNSTAEQATATEIVFVPTAASGTTGATYTYTDLAPASGVWWYWLADLDTSGALTLHGPINNTLGSQTLYNRVFLPLIRR